MSSSEQELPTWELVRLDARRARDEARELQEIAREARARAEVQVKRAARLTGRTADGRRESLTVRS